MQDALGSLGTPWGLLGSPWDPLGPPWGLVGASIAKHDFGSKTSKLAEAFDENCREGPQNSNASTIFFENA